MSYASIILISVRRRRATLAPVPELPDEFARRIALIASDRESGASEILDTALELLRDARDAGLAMRPVARGLCRAQPSMAPIWNATLEAIATEERPHRLDRFAQRVARAPAALARVAVEVLAPPPAGMARQGPLRLVTISFSRSVGTVLEALHQLRPVRLACSESRPALEGRRLASRLAGRGIPVTCFADAAIGHALAAADAVLVGADAVGPEWFLNKSGTRMLAAAATLQGVPVYVVASRDKFVPHAVGARLVAREGEPGEVWEAPPASVEVRNPYFESTPLDLVTAVISDAGLLGAGMVPDVCESLHDPLVLEALEDL